MKTENVLRFLAVESILQHFIESYLVTALVTAGRGVKTARVGVHTDVTTGRAVLLE